MLDLELRNQPLDPLALEAEIAADGAAAADDGKPLLLRIRTRFGFGHEHQRANDDVLAIVGDEPRWHRLEAAGKKQVQQERLDEVVEMMTERDFRRTHFLRDAVEDAP